MPQQISKKEADKLMKLPGLTKGSEIITLASYIEEKYGKKRLAELEQKMAELGYPCDLKTIKPAHWYKESLNVLLFLASKEIFNWKDLFEIGYNSPVFSFGVKIFIRFLSPALIGETPKIWRKFMNVGSLSVSMNEKEKRFTVVLKDYNFHPEMCRYFAGFFLRISELFIKSDKITVEETKCVYKGDSRHEYEMKWQ